MFPVPTRATLAALLALAGSGAALAQSSVNAYGLVDLSVGQFQAAGAVKNKAVQSGNMTTSFFGFKGSEDLGGGLKANFAIESFLRADSGSAGRFGTDAFWARSAYVGLSSGYGALTLGRNTTSLFVSTLVFNAFGDSFGFSPSIRHYFTSGTTTGDTGWNQSISYSSPKFGGLSGQLQIAGDDGASGRKAGAQLMYFGGSLGATAAYQKVKAGPTVKGTATWQLGGSYDLGFAKLYGQYGQVDNTSTDVTYKLVDLGAAVPLGASGKLLLQGGYLKPETGTKRATVSLGYDLALSKRSDVYAVYMNDRASALDTGHSFALGLRHRF